MPHQDVVGKLGSPGATGWIANTVGEYVVEIEALGPLTELEPGATVALELTMAACACPAPIVAVGHLRCISQPLEVRATDGGRVEVRGRGGTFVAGAADLALRVGGAELDRTAVAARAA